MTNIHTPPLEEPLPAAGEVLDRRRIWRVRVRRHHLGAIGVLLIGSVALFALAGPWVIGHHPNTQNLPAALLTPGSTFEGEIHLLGTDALGRDVLARLAAGARASFGVVAASLVLGGGIGIVVGIVSGYYGGWRDNFLMRAVDAQLALPNLVFAMVIAAVAGVGFRNTVLAIGIASWPTYARLIRADVLRLKSEQFMEAAEIVGVSTFRKLRKHILPNLITTLSVVITLELGRMILVESSLSFVGLGMQPPNASWGSMVRQGQAYIYNAWWLSAAPGLFIVVTVLGLNLVGDWLRDITDPRSRR